MFHVKEPVERTIHGPIASFGNASVSLIQNMTIPIFFTQLGKGKAATWNPRPIKNYSGLHLWMLNTQLDEDGFLRIEAKQPVTFRRDDSSEVRFTSCAFDPATMKFAVPEQELLTLTAPELERLLAAIHLKHRHFDLQFPFSICSGNIDLSGQLATCAWECLTFDGSEAPTLGGILGTNPENGIPLQFEFPIDEEHGPARSTNVTEFGSHHSYIWYTDMMASKDPVFYASKGFNKVVFTLPGVETVEGAVTWLKEQAAAGTPLQFAWKLAKPLEFKMVEMPPLRTFHGSNTIWTSIMEEF